MIAPNFSSPNSGSPILPRRYHALQTMLLCVIMIGINSVPMIAADAVHRTDVKLTKPKNSGSLQRDEPLETLRLQLWLPDRIERVRGILFNPSNEKQVDQVHMQEVTRLWGFGIIGANYSAVDPAEFARSLKAGMKQFAKSLSRPELDQVPMLMLGQSSGARICMTFADQLPKQTLAVAAIGLDVGPMSAATRGIPILTILGEGETKQLEILKAKHGEQRQKDALWAIAPLSSRKQDFAAANLLVFPFFDDVIQKRLPTAPRNSEAAVPLIEIKPTRGFLCQGMFRTDLPIVTSALLSESDRSGSWFPGEASAIAAQGMSARNPRLRILSPISLGDGQLFTPISADQSFKVRLSVARTFQKVGVRLGRDVVREARGGSDGAELVVPALTAGVHVLTAVGWDKQGLLTDISRPSCVIVK